MWYLQPLILLFAICCYHYRLLLSEFRDFVMRHDVIIGRCDPAVLLRACRRGDVHLVQTLQRRYGTDPLLRLRDCRGATCLHHAARGGHIAVLRQLIVGVRDTAPRTLVGATPLHDAAVLGQLGALKWLLQHTTCSLRDTDHEGCTVLHLAARYDCSPTVS